MRSNLDTLWYKTGIQHFTFPIIFCAVCISGGFLQPELPRYWLRVGNAMKPYINGR